VAPWLAGETLAKRLDLLSAAIAASKVQFLPGYGGELPKWPDFEEHIKSSRARGDLDQRRKFYSRAPIIEDDLAKHFTKIKKLQQDLSAALDARKISALNAYVNTAVGEEEWPAHPDEEDAIFFLCEGEVTWFLDDETYKLTAGDAIFFPAMTMHKVVANTPRAAFILGVD
jgi:mannose-6-phosphate isomerase-like protein (cupin superfamily)